MKTMLLIFTSLFLVSFQMGDKEAYRLFDKTGKETKYQELYKSAHAADVVFFGELHNNPIAHWLQYELTNDLVASKTKQVIMGAEMFEQDDQVVLNEYLGGKIGEKQFTEETKLWTNYKTDYKPLVELAKTNKIPFIATNVPRRYANMVYKGGFTVLDSISVEAKKFIAPLPIAFDPELSSYKEMLAGMGGHGGENLVKAQALKDATMAYFISRNLKPGALFIHYNGAYHSNNYEGIVWYLKRSHPNLKVLTISNVEQDMLNDLSLDNKELADYIIAVPENMTKTH